MFGATLEMVAQMAALMQFAVAGTAKAVLPAAAAPSLLSRAATLPRRTDAHFRRLEERVED